MSQFRVVWNTSTPVPATGGYKIYRKTNGGAPAAVGTAPAGSNEFIDTFTPPTGTTTYQYGVSGLNNTGQESGIGFDPNVLSVTVNEPVPSVPASVNATQIA
jgi:hypothetical protein